VTSLKCVGVLAHPTRPQTAPIAGEISRALQARGLNTWLHTVWDRDTVRDDVSGTDMVIAIGGDGAMLRAARVCAQFGVPVLGVNMGHLGFLTEIKGPNSWESAIDDVLAGRYWVETRMMIGVSVWRGEDCVSSGEALNDVVISRGNIPRTIRVDTYIDHEWTTTYNADGLIISTATGSTAYALACGGPILPPELRNILLVPVAPHLSLDRPIVLPEGANVEVIVEPEGSTETVLAVDGEMLLEMHPGDRVRVQASEHVSRFVRLRERNYYNRSLLDRLVPRLPVPPTPTRRQL
jgi:NAD+ kinase